MSEGKVSRLFQDPGQIQLLEILAIVALAGLAIVLIHWLLPWSAQRLPGRLRLYLLPSVPVLRLLILVVAIASIVPLVIEPTLQNMVTILGAAGLAIGFAFKDYVSSIIAGVVAVYERPYRTGDWVRIDDAYGEVRTVGLRALQIVTPDDTVVTIPQAKMWDTNIYNDTDGGRDLLCVADFYLEPRHDAAQVRQALHDVALSSPFLQLGRPVVVIVAEQPWGTHYRLKAYPIDSRDQFLFTSDLTVRGKAILAKLGARPAALPAIELQAGP